MLLYIRT